MSARFLLIPFLFFVSEVSFAKSYSDCQKAHKNAVDKCHKRIGGSVATFNALAKSQMSACPEGGSVSACAADQAGLQNRASEDLLQKKFECETDDKPVCNDACKPDGSEPKGDAPKMQKEQKLCDQDINKAKDQAGQGAGDNKKAAPQSKEVSDKNKSDAQPDSKSDGQKQASNTPPPQIPPMTPPSSDKKDDPPADTKKDDTPPAKTDVASATPPPTPAAPATGKAKADFQTATREAAKAAACGAPGRSSEVEGCGGNLQVASVTPKSLSNGTATGGGGGAGAGGSGGGGINAAQVAAALAGQGKAGETEKDGKNSGLKAASLNMSTDGGGGGSGGGGGGGSMGDLDSLFKVKSDAGPQRGPSAATAAQAAADAKLFKIGVGPERYPVVKIVEDVYHDRCKAGRMMHCGGNP